jgi:hypothetical protein
MPEHDNERKPLRYWYDEVSDTLVVEGVAFSGDVFRTWMLPTDRFYKFFRPLGRRELHITTVIPCADCREKGNLYPQKCRVCGCSDDNPCLIRFGYDQSVPLEANESSCHWSERDLCSACAPGSGEVRIRGPLPQEEMDRMRAIVAEELAELPDWEPPSMIELPEPRIILP